MFVLNSLNEGVTLVGGCCEVKPRHIEAIKNLFKIFFSLFCDKLNKFYGRFS